jgi:hypothetical protein
MVDLPEVEGGFYKVIAVEGVSCMGLAETWAVFRYAWGCVLQSANGTKIVWEASIVGPF